MQNQTTTKHRLMETAIALIWQSNYANVGVAAISKQAGVTKGSFYHYFDSKADLFYEASCYYWEHLRQQLDHLYSPSFTPLEQLENLITFVIEKQKENPASDQNPVSGCPFFTAGGQAGTGEQKVRQAAQEMAEKAIQYNAALVRGLQADNLLEEEGDPTQIGRMLYQYVMGLLLYGRVMYDLEIVKEDLPEALYRLVGLKQAYRHQNKRPA